MIAWSLLVLPLSLALLTALGEWRRGAHSVVVPLAGLLFPVTWLVWYVRDELRRPAG